MGAGAVRRSRESPARSQLVRRGPIATLTCGPDAGTGQGGGPEAPSGPSEKSDGVTGAEARACGAARTRAGAREQVKPTVTSPKQGRRDEFPED